MLRAVPTRHTIKIGVAILGVLLVIVLRMQNTHAVRGRPLFMTMELPPAVLLLITFLLGLAAGVLFTC